MGMLAPQCRDNVFAVIGTDFQVKERIVPIGRLKNRKGNVEDKNRSCPIEHIARFLGQFDFWRNSLRSFSDNILALSLRFVGNIAYFSRYTCCLKYAP